MLKIISQSTFPSCKNLAVGTKVHRRLISESAMVTESLRVHTTSQTSFTSNAALYDKARPSYIPDAIDAVIRMLHLQEGSKLLDLVKAMWAQSRALR